MNLRLAHSPDADDAFMFYALAEKKIDPGPFTFEHVFADIETLNQAAMKATYEITAVSLHAFAYVSDRYWLLPNGASIGKGYGPIVVSKEPMSVQDLASTVIGVPGLYTTAALALGLALGKFNHQLIPFDKIIPSVLDGTVKAGVIIHEGQLTYKGTKLHKVLDIGEWWEKETGLPLPLGVDTVRKDLGLPVARQVSDILEKSIRYAMAHEDDALDYALKFGRGVDRELGRKFVRMYVNERTLRFSDEDRKAISMILDEGYKKGLLKVKPQVSFEIEGVGA